MSNTLEQEPEQREVEQAAKWLDEQYPGWADTIDLDEFSMADSSACIGHYLRVQWYEELCLPWTRVRDGRPANWSMGVYDDDPDDVQVSQVFAAYTDIWRLEIQARRSS